MTCLERMCPARIVRLIRVLSNVAAFHLWMSNCAQTFMLRVGPDEINAVASQEMTRRGITSEHYDGEMGAVIVAAQQQAAEAPIQALTLQENSEAC